MNKSKLLGQLEVLRALGTKPNFSELSRIYGIDRHTIKKYWINGGIRIEERKNRMSILDKYIEEIKKTVENSKATTSNEIRKGNKNMMLFLIGIIVVVTIVFGFYCKQEHHSKEYWLQNKHNPIQIKEYKVSLYEDGKKICDYNYLPEKREIVTESIIV